MRKLVFSTNLLLAFTLAFPAYAYIGPGAGAGMIAVVFGVVASVFFAFVAIIWYPIKRLFKGRKPTAMTLGEESTPSE
jgi:uncharacterized membrane protein